MKIKRLIPLLGLLLPVALLAQAQFELANRHSPFVDAPVFDAQGNPLAGTNYFAELWGAATPDSLTPLVFIDRGNSRGIVPFIDRGYFMPTSSLSVPTVPQFDWAWLQVRAWESGLGATYEAAAARGLGGYGESLLFYARGSGVCGGVPCIPAPLIGLQSFRLRPTTAAVLMRGIRRDGDYAIVEWNPGFKRYQLQRTPTLGTPWEKVGEPTTATSYTNSIGGKAMFFRVAGLLD